MNTPSPLGVGVHSSIFGFGGGARRGTLLIGADILPRRSKPRRPKASRAFDVPFPDRRASFSSLVSSIPISFTWRPSTATALGPTIPQTILAQAEEVRSILAIAINYHEFAATGRTYGPRLP